MRTYDDITGTKGGLDKRRTKPKGAAKVWGMISRRWGTPPKGEKGRGKGANPTPERRDLKSKTYEVKYSIR